MYLHPPVYRSLIPRYIGSRLSNPGSTISEGFTTFSAETSMALSEESLDQAGELVSEATQPPSPVLEASSQASVMESPSPLQERPKESSSPLLETKRLVESSSPLLETKRLEESSSPLLEVKSPLSASTNAAEQCTLNTQASTESSSSRTGPKESSSPFNESTNLPCPLTDSPCSHVDANVQKIPKVDSSS